MAGAIKAFPTSLTNPMSQIYQASITGITVDTTLGNCDVLDIRGVRSLSVKPSAGITGLTFYGCDTSTGTFTIINDVGSSGALTVVASVWTVVTATAIAPHLFIRMVPNTNGTVVVVAKN